MAEDRYPKVPAKSWAALRAKAVTTPTQKWTPSFVASFLNMKNAESALANVVRPMRALGLIDDDGLLTARGNKWRSDSTYADACSEIVLSIYPEELSGFTTADGSPDQPAIATWMSHRGMGESNAKQMAATYAMIAGQRIPELSTAAGKETKASPSKKVATSTAKKPSGTAAPGATPPPLDGLVHVDPPAPPSGGPQIHLDIQIHIPPDASPQQIDTIFESMAKHLYK